MRADPISPGEALERGAAALSGERTTPWMPALRSPVAPPLTIRPAASAELRRWDEIVTGFPGWRVCHTRAWVDSLADAGFGEPLYLVFVRDGVIVGCQPGLVKSIGPLRLYGSPLPGWQTASMGPLWDPAAISPRELVGPLVRALDERHAVDHIEILSRSLPHEVMAAAGFRGTTCETFRAPLHPGDEPRTMAALESSARRNIRRAERLGVVVRRESDEQFIDEHLDQMREVFVRRGATLPFGRRRVASYVHHLRAAGALIGVAAYLPDGGTCIATGTFSMAGGELLLWNWTHRTRYRWYRPTELMTWTAMRTAMEAGCVALDLMGPGDFKAKFGATLDRGTHRWVRSRSRWLLRARDIAERAYRWQQSARGRLARRGILASDTAVEGAGAPPDRAVRDGER